MKKVTLFLFTFTNIYLINAQSFVKQFFSLSCAEKWWVMLHPFIAKKAHSFGIEAIQQTYKLKNDSTLDGDFNGGQLDAFRHAYWMALVSQHFGKRKALSLGNAHERGNYQQFKKNQLEDGTLPDYESSQMDYLNNEVGIEIGQQYKWATKEELKNIIIYYIHVGKLYILKKDSTGTFLNCNNEPIRYSEKKWKTGKCLISSNIRNR